MELIEEQLIKLRVKFSCSNDLAERNDLWNQITNLENQLWNLEHNNE